MGLCGIATSDYLPITRLLCWKLVGLAVGCAANFLIGSLYVFAVYQDAIKETFNYTQKEVELLSSMLNLGLGVGFLPGIFYDHFGPQWTSSVGLVVSVVAYMLIWSTTKSVDFYTNNAWLMSIYFFVCGLGSIFTYMVTLNTNVINFDKKHTGKVIGLLTSFFSGSPSVFAALYYHVYSHGDSTIPENQDYPAFMLTFAISFAVVDVLCIAFLRIYEDETHPYSVLPDETGAVWKTGSVLHPPVVDVKQIQTSIQDQAGTSNVQQVRDIASCSGSPNTVCESDDDTSNAPLPLLKLLIDVDYQILVWTFTFASTVGLVFVNNITVVSDALYLSRYDDRLMIIVPVTNALVGFLVGIFSDIFKERIPRMWILFGACCCFLISQLIEVFFASTIELLMTATAVAGLAIGTLWAMAPTIMKEKFYVGNLGRNWGIALFLSGLLGFGIQELFGYMYDRHITDTAAKFCYGMDCVKGGIALCAGIACLSVLFGLTYAFQRSCRRNCSRLV